MAGGRGINKSLAVWSQYLIHSQCPAHVILTKTVDIVLTQIKDPFQQDSSCTQESTRNC